MTAEPLTVVCESEDPGELRRAVDLANAIIAAVSRQRDRQNAELSNRIALLQAKLATIDEEHAKREQLARMKEAELAGEAAAAGVPAAALAWQGSNVGAASSAPASGRPASG